MRSRRLTIAIRDHGGKSRHIAGALHAGGHEIVAPGTAADVFLIDFDPPVLLHKQLIDHYAEAGTPIMLYPHAGGPSLSYDATWDPDPRVSHNLVSAPGYAEFLRRIDYPAATHSIGWTLCPLRPFRACDEVKTVVFAPVHPHGTWIPTRFRERNTRVFEELVAGPWKLIVRHVGDLEVNGLRKIDGVEYIDGRTAGANTSELARADAVVAGAGTYPGLAVAHGLPTVVYNQGAVAIGLPGVEDVPLRHPERYLDYVRFPFDAEDGPLTELIPAAAASEEPILDWKRRFLGKPFDPRAFVEQFERIVAGDALPSTLEPTRSFTTLAFADELAERPSLLAEYAAAVGPADDATLILWTPSADADTLLADAERAIERAGLDMNALPDVLLVPMPGSPQADQLLAERADAVLSDWPAAGRIGTLPRFQRTLVAA